LNQQSNKGEAAEKLTPIVAQRTENGEAFKKSGARDAPGTQERAPSAGTRVEGQKPGMDKKIARVTPKECQSKHKR